jgi:hypothetical protein
MPLREDSRTLTVGWNAQYQGCSMNVSNCDCSMTLIALFRRRTVVRDTFAAVRSSVVIGHLAVVTSSHESYIASDVWR